MFTRTDDRQKSFMTQFQTNVTVPGKWLKDTFGKPLPSLDGKNTGDLIFLDEDGNAATVYDWRNHAPEVWDSNESFEFYVGARSKEVADALVAWLTKMHGGK